MSRSTAQAAAVSVTLSWIVGAALLSWGPLWIVHVLVAVCALWLAGLLWYSAPTRGRWLGWPRGSLRPLSLAYWFDREYFSRSAAAHGCPFKATQMLRPAVCFVGLHEGLSFLERHADQLGTPPLAFSRFIPGGFLRFMPAAAHDAVKAQLIAALSKETYEAHLPEARHLFRQALTRMAESSEPTAPRSHIQRAVFALWTRLSLGVDASSPAFGRLEQLYRIIDINNPLRASDTAVRAAGSEIAAIVCAAAANRSPSAPPSAASVLLSASQESANTPALMNLVYITHTTWGDVSGLLVWVLRMLVDHPAWADRLRAAAHDATGDHRLSTRIVQETLRLEQSEHIYRVAQHTITEKDYVVPRGWLVRVCVRESHRDAAVFADPDTFNPDRFLGRAFTRRQYSPFGAGGRSACIGEGVTKAVASVFAEEVVRSWRWRTAVDAPLEYSAKRHWRPGSQWRVAASPAV